MVVGYGLLAEYGLEIVVPPVRDFVMTEARSHLGYLLRKDLKKQRHLAGEKQDCAYHACCGTSC